MNRSVFSGYRANLAIWDRILYRKSFSVLWFNNQNLNTKELENNIFKTMYDVGHGCHGCHGSNEFLFTIIVIREESCPLIYHLELIIKVCSDLSSH